MITTEYLQPSPLMRELLLLQLLDAEPNTPQSELARRVGIAPARVNSYIATFLAQGLIEVAPRSRGLSYHLTAEGRHRLAYHQVTYRAELVRLAHTARIQFRSYFERLRETGVRRVVLYGAGETAEVALDALAGSEAVEVAGVVDDDPQKWGSLLYGYRVQEPESLCSLTPDAVLISSVTFIDRIRARIRAQGLKKIPVFSLVG